MARLLIFHMNSRPLAESFFRLNKQTPPTNTTIHNTEVTASTFVFLRIHTLFKRTGQDLCTPYTQIPEIRAATHAERLIPAGSTQSIRNNTATAP